jgi:hypothetical protein
MSKITMLAVGQITAADEMSIELGRVPQPFGGGTGSHGLCMIAMT